MNKSSKNGQQKYDVNVKIKKGIIIDKNATSLRAQKLAKQAVKVTMPSNKKISQINPKVKNQPKQNNTDATRGVYINDSIQPFTEQILNGEKTIETREQPKNRQYPEFHKFIGKRIGIVRSGKGKTTLVGFATLADEIVYNTEAEFRADEDKHLVKKGSAYDIKNKRYGYVLTDVERVTPWQIPQGSKRNAMSDVDITAYHEGQPKFQKNAMSSQLQPMLSQRLPCYE